MTNSTEPTELVVIIVRALTKTHVYSVRDFSHRRVTNETTLTRINCAKYLVLFVLCLISAAKGD